MSSKELLIPSNCYDLEVEVIKPDYEFLFNIDKLPSRYAQENLKLPIRVTQVKNFAQAVRVAEGLRITRTLELNDLDSMDKVKKTVNIYSTLRRTYTTIKIRCE